MRVTYFEDTNSLLIDFEMSPERKVERIGMVQLNEQTLLNRDEAGNVWSVEIMGGVRELYGDGPVTVEGLAALSVAPVSFQGMIPEEIERKIEEGWRGVMRSGDGDRLLH